MIPLPPAADEAGRLRALASYGLDDSLRDAALDSIVRAASMLCDAPISLVSLIDSERQWFPSGVGLPGIKETPRDIAFCAHAIVEREVMVVEDAAKDPRFANNPLVLGDPHIRFYAGAPLIDREGFALGTLCVIDRQPRRLSTAQREILRELSTAVVRLLEARRVDNLLFAAELATNRARADLGSVLKAVSSRVAYWDSSLLNRFSNPAFADWAGVSRDELCGRSFATVLGDRFAAIALTFVGGALGGETQRFEHELPGPNGSEYVDVTFVPDVQDGEVVGFVSTSTDVSALRRALVSAQQRNELLTLAEELAEVGHWRVDLQTEVLTWSPQVYRIYGLDPAVFVPTVTSAIAAYHPEDRARVAALVERAVNEREAFDFELRLVRPDGTVRHVESRGRCELDPSTHTTRALFGVFRDVTEHRRIRDLLAHQDRLVTTGTLAAGVGHEINNPLTYVSANLDFAIDEVRVLAGGSPSSRMLELMSVLSEAREGADRIRKIVRGLRAFARADEPVGPTSVRAALEIAVNMSASELRNCATLVVELGEIPAALADESRLSQVFVNLIVNSAQAFSRPDPQRNHVLVRASLEDECIAIEVEDNGPGIPPHVLPRVFDPFFTTKAVGRGLGLGLAISHNIVNAFGGALTCVATGSQGTTFRIVLRAAPPPEATQLAQPNPIAQRARGRVMVIDDDDAVRRTLERVLAKENDVVAIGDSREAARMLGGIDTAFDVVFCDLMMPHLSGMDLFHRIRLDDAALAELFVFVTGGSSEESVRRFLDAVPNERLEKPFRGDDLCQIARRFVRRSHLGAEGAE